jgi:hypothetical protein
MTKKDDAIIDILKTIRDENPDSFVYVVPNLFTKKMKSFMLIREDLKFMADVTGKLIAFQSHNPPDKMLCFALWQSVIISYGKCFTENKAGMSKLEKSLLDGKDQKFQDLHDTLMDLRHSYIAHRDDTEKEQAIVFMKIPKDKDLGDQTEYQIRSRKLLSPGVNVLKTYLELFTELTGIVEQKIQKHSEKSHKAFFENLSPKQISLLLINNMKDVD